MSLLRKSVGLPVNTRGNKIKDRLKQFCLHEHNLENTTLSCMWESMINIAHM